MEKKYYPIVKYDNRLNELALGKLSASELDIFTSICSKVKDKNTDVVEFSFDELMEYSQYKGKSLSRFRQDLRTTNDKLSSLKFEIVSEDGEQSIFFVLFPTFIINGKNKTVTVQVNSTFSHLFNNLTGNFTRFELMEHVNIKSKYGKLLYRLLKQYRKTGYFTIKVEDFREKLDIPESYRMKDIDKRVLQPAMDELTKVFKNLTVTKKYAPKGRKVEFFIFTFDKEVGVNIGSQADFRKAIGTRNPELDIAVELPEDMPNLFDSDFWNN